MIVSHARGWSAAFLSRDGLRIGMNSAGSRDA
jgi:hypothetical protein